MGHSPRTRTSPSPFKSHKLHPPHLKLPARWLSNPATRRTPLTSSRILPLRSALTSRRPANTTPTSPRSTRPPVPLTLPARQLVTLPTPFPVPAKRRSKRSSSLGGCVSFQPEPTAY